MYVIFYLNGESDVMEEWTELLSEIVTINNGQLELDREKISRRHSEYVCTVVML